MVFDPYPLIPAGTLCNSSGNKNTENLGTITVIKDLKGFVYDLSFDTQHMTLAPLFCVWSK